MAEYTGTGGSRVATPTPQGIGKTIRSVTQWIKKNSKKAWDALTATQQAAEKAKMRAKPGLFKLSKKHPTGRAVSAMRKEQKRQIEGSFE